VSKISGSWTRRTELATPPVIRQHELEHPGIILESGKFLRLPAQLRTPSLAPILNFSYAPPKSSSPPTSETPPSEITTRNANVTEPIKKPEAIQTPMPNTSNETDADSSLSDWFSAFCMHLDSTISADETSSRGREGMLNSEQDSADDVYRSDGIAGLDRPTAFRSVVICENAGKKNDRDAGGDVPR